MLYSLYEYVILPLLYMENTCLIRPCSYELREEPNYYALLQEWNQ